MWRDIVERWQALAREQKLALVGLSVIAGIAFGLSLYRVNAMIREPFLVKTTTLDDAKKLLGLTNEELIAQQKRKDTDGDGLSDWDETNVYHTNPNVRDTCGDGILDNVRVVTRRGLGCLNNPNINGALNLSGVYSTSSDVYGLDGQSLLKLAQQEGFAGVASSTLSSADAAALQQAAQGILPRDATAIRQLLKEKLPQSQSDIDNLSDKELLKLYDAAVENVDQQRMNPMRGAGTQLFSPIIATSTIQQASSTMALPPLKLDQSQVNPDWKGPPPTSTPDEVSE